MAEFRPTVVTSTGISLINESLANKKALKISSIKTGNGIYTGSENLENATGLKNLKNSFLLKNIKIVDDTTIKIQTLITNDNITEGYDITEYGIYAEVEKAEKLIAIATAINADFIPAITSSPTSIFLEIYLKVSGVKEIHFDYTVPEGVYATVAQLEDFVSKTDGAVGNAILPDEWYESTAITDIGQIMKKKSIRSVLSALLSGLKFVIDMFKKVTIVEVKVNEFTNTAPYTLRINIPGMKSTDRPEVAHSLLDGVTDAGVIEGAWKAFGCIDRVDTFDGYIIVTCFRERLEQNIFLAIKGG